MHKVGMRIAFLGKRQSASGQVASGTRASALGLAGFLSGFSALAFAQGGSTSQPAVKDGVTCRTAMLPARDGTKLYTEIYLPSGSETANPVKRPVVIVRGPYANGGMSEGCFGGTGTFGFAKLGFVAIYQSVRGTGSSEGVFTPFLQEQNDGVDIIGWSARQAWSDGKVGMTSGSYMGVTQWQPAIKSPPNLVAITPHVTPGDYRDDWVGRNGVFDLEINHGWSQGFLVPNITRNMKAKGASAEQIAAALKTRGQSRAGADTLPLIASLDSETREAIPYLLDWYNRPNYDAYWKKIDVLANIAGVKIPVLVSGSWYDLFTKGTIDNYLAISTKGGSKAAREGSMLLMDCCGHNGPAPKGPGFINWGASKANYTNLHDRFLMHHLTGKDTGLAAEPKVQITVLVPPDKGIEGDTFMYKTNAWPVPGTRYVKYNLISGGKANTLNGDGVLDTARASGGAPDSFLYDPAHPVPSRGGNGKAMDETPVQTRDDVLIYTAAPASRDTLMIGRISISFWAMTDGRDTDFTAKLVDVHPDGFAHAIVDRIVRGRYRKGSRLAPELLTPNKAYEYKLDVGYAATLLKPGHRLRLEISSSNFPRYARNLNTGASNESSAQTRVARNTILHDAKHPSFVTIPIVEGPARNSVASASR